MMVLTLKIIGKVTSITVLQHNNNMHILFDKKRKADKNRTASTTTHSATCKLPSRQQKLLSTA